MTTPEQIPMFEGPAFCPLLPPHGSAAEQALYDLLERNRTTPDWIACLDCFLVGDHDFNAVIPAQERVSLLESRLQAATTAKLDVDRSFSELAELRSLSEKATANLQSIRFELKRQTVLAGQA